MAQRRMFSLQIVDTDAFLEMPATSQLLYFHLSMRGDDDGFVANPKRIMRAIGVQEDDLKVLIAKRFILTFDSGIIVIKHWRINNYIQNDRYSETKYLEEKKNLEIKENGSYTERIQPGYNMDTQYRLGKESIGKVSKGESVTPAQEAKDFFNNSATQLEIFNQICEPGNTYRELVGKEIVKFVEYWTELNKSGTKQRWEQESTFEVKRRLKKWLGNVRNFKFDKEKKGNIVL